MSSILRRPPSEILAALRGASSVWLVPHEYPDADSLGSALALAEGLEGIGCSVVCLSHEGGVPRGLLELPGVEQCIPLSAASSLPDVVVFLDFQQRSRSGGVLDSMGDAQVLVIDHHPVDHSQDFEAFRWVEPDAPATATLVQALFVAMPEMELTPTAAAGLYAALMTDTGGFRHPNSTAEAFRDAAYLVASGADAAVLSESLMYRRRPEAIALSSLVLGRIEYPLGGRVAASSILQVDLASAGATMDEGEGLISQFSSAIGVELAALLREEATGRWRVSLRSQAGHDVSAIARKFGGGGHLRAAAFNAEGSQDEVLARILAEVAPLLAGEAISDDGKEGAA